VIETVADGRYRLEQSIGRGAMAVVYLARDEELGRPVAIKILAEQLGSDESIRARFLREARLASRLSHPNVVHVYDAGEARGRLFIVMEHVPGSTLAACGKLSFGEAVGLAVQACAGLQHAHDAGLVHRDVKPANLLLREDGVLKIADFGIALAADMTQLTKQGTVLGTAAYLAPEQAAGETVAAAADTYALAAVLYELLTGRLPYRFDSLAELAALQSRGAITPPRDLEPTIPKGVEAAVMHALARAPSFRPASVSDFAQELVSSLADPLTDPTLTALTGPQRSRTYRELRCKGRRLLIAVAAAVALAVAIVLVSRRGDGRSPAPPPPRAQVSTPARGATAADEARNLSAWLRANSR
jgi:eukaryotic-like serine/threonine-protein kinase